MMISIIDFLQKYEIKNEATSKTKIYQVFPSIGLNNVGIYLRDELIKSDAGIVDLHPTKRTHCVLYIYIQKLL